jgi:hypothetical protein
MDALSPKRGLCFCEVGLIVACWLAWTPVVTVLLARLWQPFFALSGCTSTHPFVGPAGRVGRRSGLFEPDTEYFLRLPRERQVASISLTPRPLRSQSSVAVRSTGHLRLTRTPRGSRTDACADERPMQLRSNRHSLFSFRRRVVSTGPAKPLPPSPSHRPFAPRFEGLCDGDGG